MRILSDQLQKVDGEEMVADVAGAEEEPRRVSRVSLGGSFSSDLAILDHLEAAVHHSHDAHCLRGIHLLDHLRVQNSCMHSDISSIIIIAQCWTEAQSLTKPNQTKASSKRAQHRIRVRAFRQFHFISIRIGVLRARAHLGADFEISLDAEADEVRVCEAHQDVVHCVGVHVTHPVLAHVSQNAARV